MVVRISMGSGYVGEDGLSADSRGRPPQESGGGRCGCDRPGRFLRASGHRACASACGDGPEGLVWKDEVGGQSWCGCANPGRQVLGCGHCGCGKGLCVELVREGAVFVSKRKAACVEAG